MKINLITDTLFSKIFRNSKSKCRLVLLIYELYEIALVEENAKKYRFLISIATQLLVIFFAF